MKIVEITKYSKEVLVALNKLLLELSSTAAPFTSIELTDIIQSEYAHLFMAQEENRFVGCLTLLVFKIPTGTRAWIEDVVVTEQARGKGVGRNLVDRAVHLASQCGAKSVDLTSRPSRAAANNLYRKMGFKKYINPSVWRKLFDSANWQKEMV